MDTAVSAPELSVGHVGALSGREADGVSQAVRALAPAVARLGIRSVLHTVDTGVAWDLPGVEVHRHPVLPGADRLAFSPALWAALRRSASTLNVLHVHSLWTMPTICPGLFRAGRSPAVIISPHGTLTPWSLQRSKWKKRAAWFAGQKLAMARAACFHATAESEVEDIRRLGFSQPIALIPIGIDVPSRQDAPLSSVPPFNLLFLSRLHPKKGIEPLLKVWKTLHIRFPHWRLLIAGDDDTAPGYKQTLLETAKDISPTSITFVGSVFGDAKTALYRSANLFILPSHSENFGIVVAEALTHGVPVIASTGTPWSRLVSEGCGWWTPIDEESLESCLCQALSQDLGSLQRMGERGRNWMRLDFSWDSIGSRMASVYHWVADRKVTGLSEDRQDIMRFVY